jgi:glycosyltransferase involved in cell wall biosynthesis
MSQRITIIIPTRERCDTLRWAMKTCVTQDYDNLDILISDNASTDATRDVIAEYDDSRIRYVNPGRRLGMSEHWEFAFSHVTSGHVGVIGDDDGLLPGAIEELAQIIDPARPLVWPLQQYFWPAYGDPDLENSVVLPLKQVPTVHEIDSRAAVRRALHDSSRYPLLPSPYFGVVPVSAIDEIRTRSGRVFESINPDIYCAFAVASVCSTYLYIDKSYSLAGQSRHSNGASQLSGRGKGDDASAATKWDNENTIPFHSDLCLAPSIPLAVAESALQARDHLGLDCHVDLRSTISAMVRDPLYLLNPAVRPPIDDALRQMGAMHRLEDFVERELQRGESRRALRVLRAGSRSVFAQNPLLECDPREISNVFDAAIFVSAVLPEFQGRLTGPWKRWATRPRKLARAVRAARRRARR